MTVVRGGLVTVVWGGGVGDLPSQKLKSSQDCSCDFWVTGSHPPPVTPKSERCDFLLWVDIDTVPTCSRRRQMAECDTRGRRASPQLMVPHLW